MQFESVIQCVTKSTEAEDLSLQVYPGTPVYSVPVDSLLPEPGRSQVSSVVSERMDKGQAPSLSGAQKKRI